MKPMLDNHISPMEDMATRTDKKKVVAVTLSGMLLLFIANLNVNIGVYFMEKYENAGVKELKEEDTRVQAVHIAYGEDPTRAIVIMWATKVYIQSRVLYGLRKDDLRYHVSPSYQRITKRNDYGMHYWYRAGLKGLMPETKYFYSIQSTGHHDTKTKTFHFMTVPRSSSAFQPYFLVFGDLGLHSKGFDAIMDEGASLQYHAILHLGDLAYDLDSLRGLNGDEFLRATQQTAAYVPYMTVPGDHENGGGFYSYRYRFSMPGVSWPMPEEKLWYSIDIGNIHFVGYSTETHRWSPQNINKQFQWLVEDLHVANKNRHRVPWIIVLGHKPLYCSQTFPQDCNSKTPQLRGYVEELFYTFGVDLVLQGHCHSYERSWPLYKGNVSAYNYDNPTFPVYITHGTTGNEYITDTIGEKSSWSAYLMSVTDKESFGRLKVFNDTHLMWDTTLTASHKVIDSFILKKRRHGPNTDIEGFIRRARANQSMQELLLGQNLSVAKGDLSSWWTAGVMMVAFALVILLFLFRVTVVEAIEMCVRIISYFYKKFTNQWKVVPCLRNNVNHLSNV